jgi:dihydrofolate reductase
MAFKRVSLIVAVAENGVIGKDNDLIWYLPRDLKYFKDTTAGHTVIMGRKNWDSIPLKYRPLKGRDNVVITRDQSFQADGATVVHSLNEALEIAEKAGDEEPFIIGGGQIYKKALEQNLIDRMHITRVHEEFDGDTFFPQFDEKKWKLVNREDHAPDHRHKYSFSFCVWDKIDDSQ